MNIKVLFVTAALFATAIVSTAQDNTSALIPMPNHIVKSNKGEVFTLNTRTSIKTNLPDSAFVISELKRIIARHMQLSPQIDNSARKNIIEIIKDSCIKEEEHYTLSVDKKGIHIKANSEGTIFLALQTLDQILIGDIHNTALHKVEHVFIDDKPRYAHRAIMIDPARHFLPVSDVKFFIDQMARFKFNKLQIHLTDDQGWRIEIKSHPKLTEIGAIRVPNGSNQGPDNGYYTQEQMREIIEYADKRNVEIIPEIDIPGHSVAILAAYPHLGCEFRHNETKNLGKTTNMMLCAACDEVYSVYDDIIREIATLFPSEYIHLGGDEAAIKENWAKCDKCHNMMERNGYTSPSQLMIPFFNNILSSVRTNGKKAILWCELDNIWPPANEYLFPYPEDVTLVTWRNALTPKCIELTRKHKHQLLMAPGEHTYLDYPQYPGDLPEFNNWGMPVTTLEQAYRLDPGYGLPKEEQSHINGVMATLWAEAIKDINRLTYMTYPRAMAIAEAGWSQMEQRDWENFRLRLFPCIYELIKSGVSVRVPFEIVENRH